MAQKKNRIFATLHENGEVKIEPSIHSAINAYRMFFNANIKKQRINAVVELDEKNNIVRWIISNIEHGFEICPHCDGESIMHAEFRAQYCTECGYLILPCHLCDCDYANCEECPLKGNNRNYIGGIKPIYVDYNE